MRKLKLSLLLTVSSHALQAIDSKVCGQYCVLFLHKCACLNLHPTLAVEMIEKLSADAVKRDAEVVKAVRKLANVDGKACVPTVSTSCSQHCRCMKAWVDMLARQ